MNTHPSHSAGRMWGRRFFLFCGTAIFVPLVCIVLVALGLILRDNLRGPRHDPWVDLPGGKGRLVYHVEPAHEFLAEYYRTLTWVRPAVPNVKFALEIDTGGTSIMQVYYGAGTRRDSAHVPVVRLMDRIGEYYIDLDRALVLDANQYRRDFLSTVKGTYLGRFDHHDHNYAFVPASRAPELAQDKLFQ